MDRNELTLAVAAALILAVVFGWLLAMITVSLNARGPRGEARLRETAARLQAAEAAQRATEARLADVRRDLGARLAEAETELAAAHDRLERERAQTESVRAAYRKATQANDA